MTTLAMLSRLLLAGAAVLTIAALCTIGVATFQVADIQADITRILDSRQADVPAYDPADVDTLHDQDKRISARPSKDWKWIVGYSSPPRIRHADAQTIAARLATLHRNMLLTFGLSLTAAVLFALLVARVLRSIHGTIASLAADLQQVSNVTSPTVATTRDSDPNPAAPSTILDQALHAAWGELPGAANPSAGTISQDCTAAEASDVIPQHGNKPEDR